MKVADARVLVVGGVRRLGRALALDLAAHGAAVCVSSRERSTAAEVQVEALLVAGAPRAAAVAGDVRRPAGASALVAGAVDALGGLDALVFAASGPFAPTPPQELSEQAWDGAFDTIAKGFFFTACAAREAILAGHPDTAAGAPAGAVVALTDPMGLQPWATFAAHGAAKAAEIYLVKVLARAWAADGLRVCGVAPGPVDLVDDEHRAATERTTARTAVRRLVDTTDIGAAVRFCLETDAVTGVNVIVDNGQLAVS